MSKQGNAPRVRLGFGGGELTGESAATVRQTIWRLLGYARPYTLQLLLVALLVIVGSLALVTLSQLQRVEEVKAERDRTTEAAEDARYESYVAILAAAQQALDVNDVGFARVADNLLARYADGERRSEAVSDWFDAFRTLRFVHEARRLYPDTPLLSTMAGLPAGIAKHCRITL